jgi:hypothetical protein
MSAAAMANWAAGSNGVGPGVKRRVLRIIFSSLSGKPSIQKEKFRAEWPLVNHIIHNIVDFVYLACAKPGLFLRIDPPSRPPLIIASQTRYNSLWPSVGMTGLPMERPGKFPKTPEFPYLKENKSGKELESWKQALWKRLSVSRL